MMVTPSRVRGLAQDWWMDAPYNGRTLAGAWIETFGQTKSDVKRLVAPLAGAWIENRELAPAGWAGSASVAPLAGAWIETLYN